MNNWMLASYNFKGWSSIIMATQVEVNSVRTSVSVVELNEMTNEGTSPRTHTGPLSDASNKASDISSPSTPFILGAKNTFGKSFKPQMLASESRPRLSPKPYSKEQSSELFGLRKPPITTPKPHSFLKSSLYEKPGQQKPTDNEFHESASMSVHKKNIESESRSACEIFTTKNTVYSKSEPNNRHETAGINRSKSLRLTQGDKADRISITSLQTRDWLSSPKFEVESKQSPISRKEEDLFSRKTLYSSNKVQVSKEPKLTNDESESCLDDHSKVFTENVASDVHQSQVQPRTRRRPVSAIIPLSPEDQKQDHLENKETERHLSGSIRPFVRKPRPLSMNVTSQFESQSSLQFASASIESKENATVLNSGKMCSEAEQTDIGLKKDDPFNDAAKDSEKAAFSKPDFKSKGLAEYFKFTDQSLDAFDVKTKSPLINTSKIRHYKVETKQKIEGKENEIEIKMAPTDHTLEKSKVIPNDKSTLDNARASLDQRKHVSVLGDNNSTVDLNKEEGLSPGDTIKKRISLLLSVSSTSPVATELPNAEKETGNASIQQRIKELTTENSDVKPGTVRRPFQSRPLSADLTKLFLGQGTGSEIKSEKTSEKNSDSVEEAQTLKRDQDADRLKDKEDQKLSRTTFDDSPSERNHWKTHQSAEISDKGGQLVKRGHFSEHRRSFSSRHKSSFFTSNDHDENINHANSTENQDLKTVRATLFEHRVERHNAADALSLTDTVLYTSSRSARKPDGLGLTRQREPGTTKKLEEGNMHLSKEYYRQLDDLDVGKEAVNTVLEVPCNVEKKMHNLDSPDNCTFSEHIKKTSSYAEDTPNYQRIEPRYEIVQTIGTRALSEAIAMAPEDKAVTLRSRKPSFHKKDKIKTDVKIHPSDVGYNVLDYTANQFKEASPTAEDKNLFESTADKPVFTEFKNDRTYPFGHKMTPQISDERKADKTLCTTGKLKTHAIVRNENITVSEYKNRKEKNESSQILSKNRDSSKALACSFSESAQVKTAITTDTLRDKEKQSTKDNSQKSLISGYGSNHSSALITDNHPRTEVIAVDKGESRVFGLKQYQETGKSNKDLYASVLTKDYTGDTLKAVELEDNFRKHDGTISELKMSERWRKKTNSQDVERLEDSKLTRRTTKSLSNRADSLLPEEPEMILKNKERREFVDSSMVSQNVSCNNSVCKDSSLEPKATYFAVTCQVADYKKETYSESSQSEISKIAVDQDIPIHDISEDNSVRYGSAFPNSFTNVSLHYNNDISLETHCTDKVEHTDIASTSKHGVPNKNTNLDEFNCRRRTRNKSTGQMKENVIDVNVLLKGRKDKSSRNIDDKFPSYHEPNVHPMQNETRNEVRKNSDENREDVFKVNPKDSYRSGILDIDALMADYKLSYGRVNTVKDKQSKVEDQKPFHREKSKSLRVKNETCSYNWNDQLESPQSDPILKYFAEEHRPVKTDLRRSSHEKITVDSSENDLSAKQKYRGKQLEPFNWEKEVSHFSDKHSDSHTEASNMGITKINSKERETDIFRVKHQRERYTDNLSESTIPVTVDLLADLNERSNASRVTTDSRLQKALSKKSQLIDESDSNQQTHADTSSVANEGRTFASLKNDLTKFKKSLNEYSLDLKQSPSGKNQFANTRNTEVQRENEKSEQRTVKQNTQMETTESNVEKRRSLRHVRASTDYQKDTDKEDARQSYERSDLREAPRTSSHKRSRSLHRERAEDLQPDQLKQCFARPIPASRDTDTLVRETDSQYGAWSGDHQSQDSFVSGSPSSENIISTRKQPANSPVSSSFSHPEQDHHDATKDQRTASLDRSSIDMDSIDGTVLPQSVSSWSEDREVDFSFMDQPSVLDSSALKNRVQLSRRSHRRAPTLQSHRRSKSRLSESQFAVIEESDSTWMFKDTTDDKPEKEDESEDEEERTPKSSVQPQRLPVFPGMDPSILKAQLRKRQESDSPSEASGSAHLYKSPKSSLQQGPFGGRQLPSAVEKDDRTIEMSPQWLQELKSKKRLSQYENNA